MFINSWIITLLLLLLLRYYLFRYIYFDMSILLLSCLLALAPQPNHGPAHLVTFHPGPPYFTAHPRNQRGLVSYLPFYPSLPHPPLEKCPCLLAVGSPHRHYRLDQHARVLATPTSRPYVPAILLYFVPPTYGLGQPAIETTRILLPPDLLLYPNLKTITLTLK